MKKDKKGFFKRMLSSDHKVFETSMFSISVILSLVLVIGIGYYISAMYFDQDTISDEEVNASAVSGSAVTVVESPEPTSTPSGNMMINEDDLGMGIDDELANASEGYTTATVNMRSEPSLTAAVVTKVPAATKVTFVKLYKKEWMEVEYNNVNGYINAMYLSTDKPAPIETVAPRPTTAPATATPKPTKTPRPVKTPKPTKKPVKTPKPTAVTTATPVPTQEPTPKPTPEPTPVPTPEPTPEPTPNPASE